MKHFFYTGKYPKTAKKKIYAVLMLVLVGISLAAALYAAYEALSLYKEQEKFKKMADETAINQEALSQASKPAKPEENGAILPQYAKLAQQNPNLYGWVKIDDTPLNYPVMHTPTDPQMYLRLNFDNEYSIAGSIFMDYRCRKDSDNLILYGHNMKNGTMFGSLLNYQNEEYWKEHRVIHFDTLYEQQNYEVAAVFFDYVHNKNDQGFKYYDFIDAEGEEEYNRAVSFFKEKSIYDTGVFLEYGDQLLTLSTCSYHVKNGRFVVVAKKLEHY